MDRNCPACGHRIARDGLTCPSCGAGVAPQDGHLPELHLNSGFWKGWIGSLKERYAVESVTYRIVGEQAVLKFATTDGFAVEGTLDIVWFKEYEVPQLCAWVEEEIDGRLRPLREKREDEWLAMQESDLSPPDFAEYLIGYREWRVGDKFALLPIGSGVGTWKGHGEENHAICGVYGPQEEKTWRTPSGHFVSNRPPRHRAPAPESEGCDCGWNCYHEPPSLVRPPSSGRVWGAIAARGDIEVHRGGFRAEIAKIVFLAYPDVDESEYEPPDGKLRTFEELVEEKPGLRTAEEIAAEIHRTVGDDKELLRYKKYVLEVAKANGISAVPMSRAHEHAREFGDPVPKEFYPDGT